MELGNDDPTQENIALRESEQALRTQLAGLDRSKLTDLY